MENELEKVSEFLDGWIKSTEELLAQIKSIRELAEESRNLEEFEKRAKEIAKETSEFLRDELECIVREAIDQALERKREYLVCFDCTLALPVEVKSLEEAREKAEKLLQSVRLENVIAEKVDEIVSGADFEVGEVYMIIDVETGEEYHL